MDLHFKQNPEQRLIKGERLYYNNQKTPTVNLSLRKRAMNLLKPDKKNQNELEKTLEKINDDLERSYSQIEKIKVPRKRKKQFHIPGEPPQQKRIVPHLISRNLRSKSSDNFRNKSNKRTRIRREPSDKKNDNLYNNFNKGKEPSKRSLSQPRKFTNSKIVKALQQNKDNNSPKMNGNQLQLTNHSPKSGTFGENTASQLSTLSRKNQPVFMNSNPMSYGAFKKPFNVKKLKNQKNLKKNSKQEDESMLTISQKLQIRLEHVKEAKMKNAMNEIQDLLESQEISEEQKKVLENNESFKKSLENSLIQHQLKSPQTLNKSGNPIIAPQNNKIDLQKLIESTKEQEIGELLKKVHKKNSYLAIYKLQKKRNKHKLLVKAARMGTKRLLQTLEKKKYKEELEILQKRKQLEKLKKLKEGGNVRGSEKELKLLKKRQGQTLSQKLQQQLQKKSKALHLTQSSINKNQSENIVHVADGKKSSGNPHYSEEVKNKLDAFLKRMAYGDTQNEGENIPSQNLNHDQPNQSKTKKFDQEALDGMKPVSFGNIELQHFQNSLRDANENEGENNLAEKGSDGVVMNNTSLYETVNKELKLPSERLTLKSDSNNNKSESEKNNSWKSEPEIQEIPEKNTLDIPLVTLTVQELERTPHHSEIFKSSVQESQKSNMSEDGKELDPFGEKGMAKIDDLEPKEPKDTKDEEDDNLIKQKNMIDLTKEASANSSNKKNTISIKKQSKMVKPVININSIQEITQENENNLGDQDGIEQKKLNLEDSSVIQLNNIDVNQVIPEIDRDSERRENIEENKEVDDSVPDSDSDF